MVNFTPRQIIAIGAAIVFGPPGIIGIIVGYFINWLAGIAAGMMMFVVVVIVAQREIAKRQKESQNQGKDDEPNL